MIIETLSHWLRDERVINSEKLQFAPLGAGGGYRQSSKSRTELYH